MPLCLAPYLMRYLVCTDEKAMEFEQTLTMNDIEMVDPVFGRNMRLLLAMDDMQGMGLDFSELDERDAREVTNENKKEYIKRTIGKKLFSDRMRNMEAMRRGFRCVNDLVPFINQLDETDMALLISEKRFIDKQVLIDTCIRFEGAHDHMLQQLCKQVLRSMSDEQLQRFLFFATGQVGMYNGGSDEPLWNPNSMARHRNRITLFLCDNGGVDALPVAHVCFYRVDIPRYDSADRMKQKLLQAIMNIDDSFTIA